MKKRLISLFFILLLVPLVSSLSIEMKSNFSPGETLLASLEGNFLSPITPEDIYFYSGRTIIPLISDIARIGNKYYLYALLPNSQKEYLLVIKNVHYFENGEEHESSLAKNFSVSGNISDFSVFPGFIIAKNNFTITLESKNQNFEATAVLGNQTKTINVPAGQKRKIFFSASQGIENLSVSALSTSYSIPVAILSQQAGQEISENTTVSETEKFRFSKREFNFSLNNGKKETFTIQLINLGEEINNITIISPSPSISISPDNFDLDESESKSIELTILTEETGTFITKIRAKSGNLTAESDLIITSFETDVIIPSQINQKESCISFNGIICKPAETCSGNSIDSLEGACCIGSCGEEKSYTGIILGTVVIILILAGLFFLYKKSKARSKNPEEIIRKREEDYESRIASRETRGNLSRI